ncbi:hypothetical protein VB620_05350 [Nodularia harveyana UHCC-0300]|uniref:Sigma-70 family RNA polymerase sigma factor n=1 Tax=Nodularia harveyana UHCC-0300 TaxID=2974287 RepID=A0ABU5UB58_9CYAN|nr:hypothetical protein [Nodularia harveyana]MEA5580766.1 hypothetical protein [Nodularia harveyana UHCC-0300]
MPPNSRINQLQAALKSSVEKRRLLQERAILLMMMNDIPTRQWLFEQWQVSHDSDAVLSLIVDMMKCSESIWRGGAISADIYDEAYSKTWVWFIEHLPTYNPQLASFITWFNHKLRWIIIDISRQAIKISSQKISIDNSWIDPPAPDADQWDDTVEDWLALVQNNKALVTNRMQSSPHINCELLLTNILWELKDNREFSWDTLALAQGTNPEALRRFCKRRCFPCFQTIFSN